MDEIVIDNIDFECCSRWLSVVLEVLSECEFKIVCECCLFEEGVILELLGEVFGIFKECVW